jgi:hypothetical protein
MRGILLAVIPGVLGGCIAHVNEERVYGAPHAEADTSSWVVVERRNREQGAGLPDSGSPGGGVIRPTECRDVRFTGPIVKDVDVRRWFVDPRAQERNAAFVMLAAAGFASLTYQANQAACAKAGACDELTTARYAVLGFAAIPLGFLAFNALRARDSREVEGTQPERTAGPWHLCSSGGLPSEAAELSSE